MKKEELIAKAKLRVRKTSKDILDEDVGQLVEVALAWLNVRVSGAVLCMVCKLMYAYPVRVPPSTTTSMLPPAAVTCKCPYATPSL